MIKNKIINYTIFAFSFFVWSNLHILHQPNRAVRLDVAVLPGDACSVQQQRIEYLRVVADVPQGFVLEKEPWKRHIGRRWALRRELAKSFYLTSYPIHQSIHFCVD